MSEPKRQRIDGSDEEVTEKEDIKPSGLIYLPDFLTEDEEKTLLDAVDTEPWSKSLARRVQQYGWRYDYRSRTVQPSNFIGPLPKWTELVTQRLLDREISKCQFSQLIVNEYIPGQGIAPHIDQPQAFGPEVVMVSLGSPVCMDFCDRRRGQTYTHLLQPRSVTLIRGDARYKWTHSIAKRKIDVYQGQEIVRSRRVSLTLRTIRNK